jgi:hypothetical protein
MTQHTLGMKIRQKLNGTASRARMFRWDAKEKEVRLNISRNRTTK